MAAFAEAAAAGGAVGIRANGAADILAIKARISLPVVGLFKDDLDGIPVRITPTREHARAIADAGADIIAVDATDRRRLDGEDLRGLIEFVSNDLALPVCADISTASEGRSAALMGAAYVATTLAGYTEETRSTVLPALGLVSELAETVNVPLLAEGGIATPEQAIEAMTRGAYAVIVGTAITRPELVSRRFSSLMNALLAVGDGQPR
jgi:N-acylglucosamine-6-phosphate 2-epimerase